MIYPLRSKPKKELAPKIFTAVIIFVVLAVSQYFFSSPLKNIFHTLAKPVWFVSSISVKPFGVIGDFFKTKNSLINENQALKDALTGLQLKGFDYDVLQKENDNLRSQLGRNDSTNKIIVSIISKPPQSPYDTFVVDAGSSEGIVLGSKAFLSDKIIVGTVKEVGSRTSIVELYSTKSVTTQVVLERTGNTFSIIGQGGGNYKLEIPKDTDLVWGDTFVFPGSENSVVGSVYYIDTNSQSAFKTVYIRSPINTFSYKTLLIEGVN